MAVLFDPAACRYIYSLNIRYGGRRPTSCWYFSSLRITSCSFLSISWASCLSRTSNLYNI